MHEIEFRLTCLDGSTMTIGYLKWPRQCRRFVIDGDLVEVFERAGTRAVFSLQDVRLHDLFSKDDL